MNNHNHDLALSLSLVAFFSVTLVAVGCGRITTERERNQAREINGLRGELESKDAAMKTTEADLASSKKALAEREVAANTLLSDAAKKSEELAALSKSVELESAKVAAANARIVDLRRRYNHHDEEVAKLTSEIEARSAELATASADNAVLVAKEAELKKNLDAAKAERENAAKELKTALEDQAKLEKSITAEKRTGLQVFLENSAPDTMFGAAASDVADVFVKRGDNCAVVLDFDPNVQLVRATDRSSLPSLNGYTILSMRVAYRKVAICLDGNKIESQVEKGFLYRGFGYGTERILLMAKETSSCDQVSSDIKAASVLGDSQYVMLNPFRGEMDGIETVDLPANEHNLRLHMGSAVVGAPSCAEASHAANASDLVALACATAVDRRIEGFNVTKGCFSKKSLLGRESTRFTAE